MSSDFALRKHLVDQLQAGHAHVTLTNAVEGWVPALRGGRPPGANHSAWELLEHLRISQSDILEFCRDATHVSPEFPDGYWPESPEPPSESDWEASIAQFERDLLAMQSLVGDPENDLYERIPHGGGQTLLRESLVLASHNGYHTGQLMTLRKILGV